MKFNYNTQASFEELMEKASKASNALCVNGATSTNAQYTSYNVHTLKQNSRQGLTATEFRGY
jgi:hypothetical protein